MLGLVGAICAAGLLGWAQYGSSGGGITAESRSRLGDTIQTDPLLAEKRLRALNADRQKSLVSDTDKLVKLARRLDAEVASNPTDELTPEERREVADIEKLAHNIKVKMAQSFTGGPQFQQSPIPIGSPRLQ